MQLIRGLVVVATIAASWTVARSDGEVTLRGVYYKERATRVEQPMVDGRFDVGDAGTLDGHLLIDAITSASTAAGGGAAFDERRVEGGLGYAHRVGRFTGGVTARYSTEPDYRSMFVTMRGQAELFAKNFTIGVNVGAGHDTLSNAGAPDLVERISGSLDTVLLSGSVSQILGENTIAAVTYDVSVLDGFQQNPYRMVAAGGALVAERHPDHRVRQAAALLVRRYLPQTSTTLIAGYRYYRDDWGIRAHTPDLRFVQDAGDTMQFGLSYRLHRQGAADFWSAAYTTADAAVQPYLTDDGKLATTTTHQIAAKLSVTGATFGAEDRWAEVRGDFMIEYYLQDDRYFGNAGIAHAAVTFPVEY